MGRRRRSVTPCDDALRALIEWMRTRLDEQGLVYAQLAKEIGYDRSSISRALSGQRMPSWPMIEGIATRCGSSGEMAQELWEAARASQRRHLTRETEGYPPPDIDGYPGFCGALRDLLDRRGISHRELCRRDKTLRRSTVGAVLRMERSAQRDVTIAIVRACGVSDAALKEWAAAWNRLAAQTWQEMERRRWYIAHCYAAGSHRRSGAW